MQNKCMGNFSNKYPKTIFVSQGSQGSQVAGGPHFGNSVSVFILFLFSKSQNGPSVRKGKLLRINECYKQHLLTAVTERDRFTRVSINTRAFSHGPSLKERHAIISTHILDLLPVKHLARVSQDRLSFFKLIGQPELNHGR